jgi:hypothetical protein
MSSNSTPIEFLMVNWYRLVFSLVYVIGIVLALTTWRRHPRASLLSLIAFVLFFLANFLAAGLYWYVLIMRPGMTSTGLWLTAGNIVVTAIIVLGWILILFALFARRPWQPDRSAGERERYPRQYPERDAPAGPSSQDIRK